MNLKAGFSLLRSLFLKDRPIYVHFAVTDRCDLRCRACTIWQRKENLTPLSVNEIKDLAKVVADLGCINVSLGGGEPSLREDLPDVVRAFLDEKIRVRVLTNGASMTTQMVDRLLDAGLRDFSFSLDSMRPDLQDRLDNVKGAHKRRLENLIYIAQKVPQGSVSILNTVVSPLNVNEVPKIVALAEQIGFFASFIPIHLAADEKDRHTFFGNDPDLRFSKEHETYVRKAFEFLIKAKEKGRPIISSTPFLQQAAEFLLTGKANWDCRAGQLYLSVSPDGVVSPCHYFEGQWGIHFSKFKQTFHSDTYRKEVQEKAATCEGCYRPCWAEVSYMVGTKSGFFDMAHVQKAARKKRPIIDEQQIRKMFAAEES